MANYPIRRNQIIAPFGVGSVVVVKGGFSLISGGLDHWFSKNQSGHSSEIDTHDFIIREWRLEETLNISHFRSPPDFRKQIANTPNCNITVPFLRFPQWYFCSYCHHLKYYSLSLHTKEKCLFCKEKKQTSYLRQVSIVAMCENGHMQDFPWREWVHENSQTSCKEELSLIATGITSLAGQKVKCACGCFRHLARITDAIPNKNSTHLSSYLNGDKTPFLCQGKRPWLGVGLEEEGEPCTFSLRGAPIIASNTYFAHVKSSIYLPQSAKNIPSDLLDIFKKNPICELVEVLSMLKEPLPEKINRLYKMFEGYFVHYSKELVGYALETVLNENEKLTQEKKKKNKYFSDTEFRFAEFKTLREPQKQATLLSRAKPIESYKSEIQKFFSRILQIHKLKETRVLVGFSRVFPENERLDKEERTRLFWKNPPKKEDSWLPAYEVYGEGLYFEFNERLLNDWENQPDVLRRVENLSFRFQEVQKKRKIQEKQISPRFILLHTFSHLLMNQFIFECGYSSASLRERLYVSDSPKNTMAGILIYTASGDADGTMGGLVRMGNPGILDAVLQKTLERAMWCSADPVCMEIGVGEGQGPDSCNLAACHNCALVPETSCEEFNRFLDRALVIGDSQNNISGYFSES